MKVSDAQLISSKAQKKVSKLFSLRADKIDNEAIDYNLRTAVEMKGSTLWVLMFAIIIASIGLNVNSIAIVIGAMLISPLMGPIMGIGYGIGIYDFNLIRTSIKHLLISVAISLSSSALYFMISPLTKAQSVLLTRTTPSIWDVIIALLGGLAGILGATTSRTEKTNVIPGVAIATALMPPLCTAGFELVKGDWLRFGGAIYLFTINSVFIALASVIVVRVLRIRKKTYVDKKVATRIKAFISFIAIVTFVPSVYLAYGLVQNELFMSNANQFIDDELSSPKVHITQSKIDPGTKIIEVAAIGNYIPPKRLTELSKRLPRYGLTGAKLVVYQQTERQSVDVTSLRTGLLSDLYEKTQIALEKKAQQVEKLRKKLDIQYADQEKIKSIPTELHALYPQISNVLISNAISWSESSGISDNKVLVLSAKTDSPVSKNDETRIKSWLNTRFKSPKIKLIIHNGVEHSSNSKSRR